jgi:hypothetical protein
VTVFVNAAPNVTLSANPSILASLGLSSTLTASGAANYQWSTGATGSVIVVIPLATTTYSVIGTDANGCTGTASATVSLNLLGGLLSSTSLSTGTTNQNSVDSDGEKIPSSNEPGKEITLYPNPSSGVFYVKNAPENSTIEVYSIVGERVYANTIGNEVEAVDLGQKANGIYIIRINYNGTVVHQARIIRN